MTHIDENPTATMRDLSKTELEHVSGGMKWDPNHVSSDVIDARGGSFTFLGLTYTFDVKGKLSGIG